MRIIVIQTFPFEGDYYSLGLKKGRKILSPILFSFHHLYSTVIKDPFEAGPNSSKKSYM